MKASHVVNPVAGSMTGMMWSTCTSLDVYSCLHPLQVKCWASRPDLMFLFFSVLAAFNVSYLGGHLRDPALNTLTMKLCFLALVQVVGMCHLPFFVATEG